MEKPRLYDLHSNILLVIICICGLSICWTQFKQAETITKLTISLEQQKKISQERQTYLNRRIDLVDLAIRDANITAESAWLMADKKKTSKWNWIEGRTTQEVTAIWTDHLKNGTPLPQ